MKILKSIFFFCLLGLSLNGQDVMLLKTCGKVVIGDTTQISTPGSYNLYVQNGVMTERVKVALKSATDWSDDAFERTPSLAQMEQSISTKSHLYAMPSADELVEEGYELQAMDAKLLEQIEWLWQHMIEIKKENQLLKAELNQFKTESKE